MKQLKTFAAYVAPSVFACALSGIYAIVDAFLWETAWGISAVRHQYRLSSNCSDPGPGTGIGMGGAVMYSIRRARERKSWRKII